MGGCISSKAVMPPRSSGHSQHHHHHYRAAATLLTPSNTKPTLSALHLDHNHTIDALELMARLHDTPSPKDDDVDANTKEYGNGISKSRQWSPEGTMERCASFHTVKEYDALLQGISSLPEPEPEPEPMGKDDGDTNFNQVTTDSAGMKDSTRDDDERGIKRKKIGKVLAGSLHMGNTQFDKVASLRQWLDFYVNSPGGGRGGGDHDHATPKFGTYYDDHNKAAGEDSVEEESIIEVDPELVAALEEYMQQLQVEEDNILKHIQPQTGPGGHALS